MENLINGTNFAKKSDFIFSEIVTRREYEKLKKNNPSLHVINELRYLKIDAVWYINPNIQIKENQVIFCHTEVLEILFKKLGKVSNLKNIKLITHQSDRSINFSTYRKLPKCVSEWYSTNIEIKRKNLFGIPIGINDFYNLNFFNDNLYEKYFKVNYVTKKEKKIYANFTINTNPKHRINALKSLKNSNTEFIIDLNTNIENYYSGLQKFQFILCPWGNGIDTHRFWEALYLGSIPITKNHINYSFFNNVPNILVDDYQDISEDILNQNIISFIPDKVDELNIDYWIEKINKKKVDSDSTFVNTGINDIFLLIKIFKLKYKLKSKLKIIKYFCKKYLNPKNYYKFIKKSF